MKKKLIFLTLIAMLTQSTTNLRAETAESVLKSLKDLAAIAADQALSIEETRRLNAAKADRSISPAAQGAFSETENWLRELSSKLEKLGGAVYILLDMLSPEVKVKLLESIDLEKIETQLKEHAKDAKSRLD